MGDPLELVLVDSENNQQLTCWGDNLIPTLDKEFDERKPRAIKGIQIQFKEMNLTDAQVLRPMCVQWAEDAECARQKTFTPTVSQRIWPLSTGSAGRAT